jgi:hypothetical protein
VKEVTMSEEPKQPQQPSTEDVVEELNQLGRRIGQALKEVWESPERRELEQEVQEGLRTLGEQVDEALKTAKERLEAEGIPQQAQQVAESVAKSSIAQEIRDALLTGLRFLNQELSRILKEEQPTAAEQTPPPSKE